MIQGAYEHSSELLNILLAQKVRVLYSFPLVLHFCCSYRTNAATAGFKRYVCFLAQSGTWNTVPVRNVLTLTNFWRLSEPS